MFMNCAVKQKKKMSSVNARDKTVETMYISFQSPETQESFLPPHP